MVIQINDNLLDRTILEAKESPRKRKTFNFHQDFEDPINRMVNAIEPFSYIHPHKHENPDKREVFLILRGRLAAIFFRDNGEISEHFVLDSKAGMYGVEIPPRTWHTFISLESGTVVYELKDGPYFPLEDKNFASWAPKENDPKCADYLKKICEELNLI